MEEDVVKCQYCGEEIYEDEAVYVEGNAYCDECYREAEEFADV